MSSVSSIALAGLTAASRSFAASARKVADPSSNADLAGETVNQLVARTDFAANAAVLRADARMTGALLDIIV